MNNRIIARLMAIAMAIGIQMPMLHTLKAQTDVDLGKEVGGRMSIAIDKKLSRSMHLAIKEEVRMDDNFSSFDRFHTSALLSYKVNPHLKLGFGYALINPYSSSDKAFKNSRHRMMLDATYGLRFGNWRLSLKERFQATYRTGDMNLYQNPRIALSMKSRLKLQYKGWRRIEPYASIELRNTLNAPSINANYDGSQYLTDDGSKKGDPGWFLDGFNKVYLNRLRLEVGASYQLNKNSSLDLSLMADRVVDYVVDANAEGTKLKSYTRETGLLGWVCLGYCFSF